LYTGKPVEKNTINRVFHWALVLYTLAYHKDCVFLKSMNRTI